MAVDLAAIRKRVQELNGQYRRSSVQLWKPAAGEYKVRGLPWKSTQDGIPFIERRFYYIGTGRGILAPSQFGKPDPINDLIRKLYSTGDPNDRAMAKKLQPKMRAYMPLIVRGQEDKGVQVWSFGKMIYQALLGLFTDEDCGDFLDPQKGFDLKVAITPSPKKVDGRSFMDTTVKNRPHPSPLSDDPELAKKWLDSVPNIDDMYQQSSVKEIEDALNAWLESPDASPENTDDGTSHAGSSETKDPLADLADDVKATSETAAKAEKPVAPKRATKKAPDVDLDAPASKQSLDDAFADLMKDDD